jgi:hypothetical protein
MMEAGKNSVIYMGLFQGPNKAVNICGKTKVTGTMQRGSTVLNYLWRHFLMILHLFPVKKYILSGCGYFESINTCEV